MGGLVGGDLYHVINDFIPNLEMETGTASSRRGKGANIRMRKGSTGKIWWLLVEITNTPHRNMLRVTMGTKLVLVNVMLESMHIMIRNSKVMNVVIDSFLVVECNGKTGSSTWNNGKKDAAGLVVNLVLPCHRDEAA